MSISPYISLARIDNWTKNLVVLVGMGVAVALSGFSALPAWGVLLLTLISVCMASSANYVMNEAMDSASDAYHPIKKKRAAVKQSLNTNFIIMEYAGLAFCALGLAYDANTAIFYITCFYIACAWAYNIPPIRCKDKAYGDVVLESINYPIRILLGWMCVFPHALPPSSVLIIAWSIGAFAMSLKRLAEYQLFKNPEQAKLYRKSYHGYTHDALVVSSYVYGMIFIFGITIFLLKYKVELILLMPFLMTWLSWYFLMGLRQEMSVIYPERMVQNRVFIAFSAVTLIAIFILIKSDIPWLHVLDEPLKFAAGQ